MSERKIPIYLECGYSIAMQVLGGKWKICIIEALRDKPLRPSLIFKEVPDATERVINQQLKELLEYKIIDRKIYAEQPPRTEYFLTDLGRSAFPLSLWRQEIRPRPAQAHSLGRQTAQKHRRMFLRSLSLYDIVKPNQTK